MDVMLIVDTSQSMAFNNYGEQYSSPCLTESHWTTGSHLNNNNESAVNAAQGCKHRLDVTKEVLNDFTANFIEKNSENRVCFKTKVAVYPKKNYTFAV